MRWRHGHRQLDPFVDQAELVRRMRADLIALRIGVRLGAPDKRLAVQSLDGWISRTISALQGRDADLGELEIIAEQWRYRRASLLKPEPADVIVVDRR